MKVHEKINKRTDRLPTLWFAPRIDEGWPFKEDHLLHLMGCQHGTVNYVLYGADLIALASMLRIPGYAQRLRSDLPAQGLRFRSAWIHGADYRACQNFRAAVWQVEEITH